MCLLLLNFFILGLSGCEIKSTHSAALTEPDTTQTWYSACISQDNGEQFHSELTLATREITKVSISAETSIIVGFLVEKGYKVSKDPGTILMGTEEAPHLAEGSPRTRKEFDATNGWYAIPPAEYKRCRHANRNLHGVERIMENESADPASSSTHMPYCAAFILSQIKFGRRANLA
ncbi:hypothetical protein JIN85_17545 [Luteolibacter pohnpeiensis]|uniref:Uncharacterized protein n=1 Tax=Luteolibacter pohnpeiensis TaxID=454153 RepID=A0A934VXU8_9BACT|nr:hypothetical protein [Luteolibacter pohnpeiensis]MBK1884228.1 hypothetical protein [Luteolibacter pohnpeiensis]